MRFLHLPALVVAVLLAAAASASAGLPDVVGLVRDLAQQCIGPVGGPQCGPWP